ncbi:MAG: FIST N-terminal domain-containing protein, partial [Myxococcota bacterium]
MTSIVTASASADATTAGTELADRLAETLDGQAPALVFVFASTQQPLEGLLPPIVQRFPNATVLSASTAGEFTEQEVSKGAAVAAAIAGDFEVRSGMGTALAANAEQAVSAALTEIPDAVDGFPHRTAVMLLDPLSGNGERSADRLLGVRRQRGAHPRSHLEV